MAKPEFFQQQKCFIGANDKWPCAEFCVVYRRAQNNWRGIKMSQDKAKATSFQKFYVSKMASAALDTFLWGFKMGRYFLSSETNI